MLFVLGQPHSPQEQNVDSTLAADFMPDHQPFQQLSAMDHFNPANVIALLAKEFPDCSYTDITEKEEKVARKLAALIRECCSYEMAIDTQVVLELDDSHEPEDEFEKEDSDDEEATIDQLSDDQLEQALQHYRSTATGTRPLSSMHKKFRFVKGLHHIRQIKHYEKRMKPRLSEQYRAIGVSVYKRFLDLREKRLPLHDRDLRRWALQEAQQIGVIGFKASRSWLHLFKRSHAIVGRKITKFVTRVMVEESEDIDERAATFVAATKPLILERHFSEVFNADQSGFQKEIHSGRSLDTKGVKAVEAVVQSLTAISHSYTILPVISASGELKSPLFICLQENSGSFPKSGIFQAANIYATCHTSHMMTKELMKEWFSKVYFPQAPDNSLLLVDSWNSWTDEDAIKKSTPADKKITIRLIPPKTTPKIQPLDVAFFRTWKNFVRRFSDRILLDDLPIQLYQRTNIIKLQSLVHNQFSACRFVNFIRYAWHASGYLDERGERFENPVEYCFPDDLAEECAKSENGNKCGQGSFLRCAHCELVLCFNHFFVDYHYCS
jgi:hypothetical protein